MEHKKSWIKLTVAGMASALLLANCTTTYDSYGRPVQSVDPVAVAAGAVILGAVAYSAGKDDRSNHRSHYRSHHRSYRRGYDGGHCGDYYGGYRGHR